MDTFIYMVDSLSCTAETKTTVFQQIKKNRKEKEKYTCKERPGEQRQQERRNPLKKEENA